jgi:hypothetical protein
MRRFVLAAFLLAAVQWTSPVWAQPNALLASQKAPLSDRVVAYNIDVHYNAKQHSLDATETLIWKNYTGQPQERIPFHLYLNAFQPKSTFTAEGHLTGNRDVTAGTGWDKKKYGAEEIKSFEVVGMGDLTSQLRFIHPDDDNADDHTVVEVKLPRPVAPNQTVTFKIVFHDQFPEVVARSGYHNDFLLAGQWFPKIGVWWKNSWNCHQYHASTEFFADFGTFDVKLTLPDNFKVGATGVQTAEARNTDGTKTLAFHAEDVHDFAWTADTKTTFVDDTVTLSNGTVKLRLIMQPGHMGSAPRYMEALKGTMQKFDDWVGPYPYAQVTVVDPAYGAGAAGGMEYPTFITADTSDIMPSGVRLPEAVVEHEFGHQYWYGMVATNEFENAWLDEGINQYTECKVMDALYGRQVDVVNTRLGTLSERGTDYLQHYGVADYDPLSRNAWQYVNFSSYGGVTYGKTALMLLTLEHLVGEQKLRQALRVYFDRYKFKHPTQEDFMNTVNEVTGQNLNWFWDQAVRGTQVLDYRIQSASSERTDWATQPEKASEKKGKHEYLSDVVVHRRGEFVFPVTLEVKFDDGETVREQWDGRDRWHRFSWTKRAQIVSAQIDPDHHVWLDHDLFNNSWRKEQDRSAVNKLGMYWTVLTQWFAQILSWLA